MDVELWSKLPLDILVLILSKHPTTLRIACYLSKSIHPRTKPYLLQWSCVLSPTKRELVTHKPTHYAVFPCSLTDLQQRHYGYQTIVMNIVGGTNCSLCFCMDTGFHVVRLHSTLGDKPMSSRRNEPDLFTSCRIVQGRTREPRHGYTYCIRRLEQMYSYPHTVVSLIKLYHYLSVHCYLLSGKPLNTVDIRVGTKRELYLPWKSLEQYAELLHVLHEDTHRMYYIVKQALNTFT